MSDVIRQEIMSIARKRRDTDRQAKIATLVAQSEVTQKIRELCETYPRFRSWCMNYLHASAERRRRKLAELLPEMKSMGIAEQYAWFLECAGNDSIAGAILLALKDEERKAG